MTGEEATVKAKVNELIGIPYSTLDCQALIERILDRAGVTHINWRGSNHMWRAAVDDRMTVAELMERYNNNPPAGIWLFTIKNDGGEKKRGYNDNYKNAAHVGWYCGDGQVIHSTTGGVQWDVLTNSHRWTHAAKCILLEYPDPEETENKPDSVSELLDRLKSDINDVIENYKEESKNET